MNESKDELSHADNTTAADLDEESQKGLQDEVLDISRPETPTSSTARVTPTASPQTPQPSTQGSAETWTPPSKPSREFSTPRSPFHTTTATTPSTSRTRFTSASTSTAGTRLAELSIRDRDKVPAYRRPAAIFSTDDTSVARNPCLQCAILGLPCDLAWPTCSRCLRRQESLLQKPATSVLDEQKLTEPCLPRRRLLFDERSDIFSAGIYYTTESVLVRLVDDDAKAWDEKLDLELAKLEQLLGQGREIWARSGMRYLATFAMFNYPPNRLAHGAGRSSRERWGMVDGVGALGFAPRRPDKESDMGPGRLRRTELSGP